ncbi:MAG: hypothetical protein VX589_14030 [Myxococcota bacterium]|nr:hypothetical protein [Myxococcota bacterium]
MKHAFACLWVGLALTGCSDPPVHQDVEATPTEQRRSAAAKADLPWESEGIADAWRSALTCATAFGTGASDAAVQFGDQLWRLPGIIVSLVSAIGEELLRRERDLLMSLSDEAARDRVRATAESDLRRLRTLLSYLRRAIPALWSSLEDGTSWFDSLERDEKVQFVCEVSGRIAFEALVLIAADKGLSKLTSLTRLQLVGGIQSQATQLYNAGRLAYVTRKSIREVGTRMAGRRLARIADPTRLFAALGTVETYQAIEQRTEAGVQALTNTALPAFAIVNASEDAIQLLLGEEQWAKAPGNGWIDVLLPIGDLPPDDAIVVEASVTPEIAAAAVRALENQSDKWPQPLTSLLSSGVEFARYHVPADAVLGPNNSPLKQQIDDHVQQLSELLEMPIEDALRVLGDYIDKTPEARLETLKDFIYEASIVAEDAAPSDPYLDDIYGP